MNLRNLVAGIVANGIFFTGMGTGFAEDSQSPSFTLDQLIVTAQRYEKNVLDVPASAEVITQEQLKNVETANLEEALAAVTGVAVFASSPGGNAINPASNSEIVMRGVSSGTLVLVNGVPLNLNNRYDLNDIPVSDVERVEIIKTAGSVLYGSEATGGIINIITKKERQNYIKTGYGNFGQQKQEISLQEGKLGFGYSYDKWGNVDRTSLYDGSKYNNTKGSEENNFSTNYRFNDKLNLLYTHNEANSATQYRQFTATSDKALNDRKYETKKDYLQLQYDDDAVKGTVYYNAGQIDYTNFDVTKSTFAYNLEKNRTYGFDVQKTWMVGDGKVLFGGSYQHEYYLPNDYAVNLNEYERNNYAFYGQYEKPLDDKNTLIVGARETWTGSSSGGKNYNNLSGSGQFVHKLNENERLYASVTESFKMPTFKQIYARDDGKYEGNPNVKPETGVHYETGWKKNSGDHQWKAALFHYDIKDNITSRYDKTSSSYYYDNEDFKNTGIELSCAIADGKEWNYQYGIVYQNPLVKPYDTKNGTAVSDEWLRKYGRIQLNGGVTYSKDKWRTSLTATYLAERYMLSSSSNEATKPYLVTDLSVNYKMDAKQELNLSINNLLDREDNLGHTGTYYYSTPINFLLSYKLSF